MYCKLYGYDGCIRSGRQDFRQPHTPGPQRVVRTFLRHGKENNMPEEITLDDADRKILGILMENARISIKEIADRVYLTSPTVTTRIHRMEKAGILRGYQPSIDYRMLGYTIKAFINLEVAPKDKPTFYPFIKSVPNVVECSCVTGDYSMLIECVFRYSEDLDHLINELQRFGRTKTLIAFSTSVNHRCVPV